MENNTDIHSSEGHLPYVLRKAEFSQGHISYALFIIISRENKEPFRIAMTHFFHPGDDKIYVELPGFIRGKMNGLFLIRTNMLFHTTRTMQCLVIKAF